MTAQTVSSAVAQRDSGPAEMVRQSRDWFRTVVPSHIDANAFVALAIANLRKNPALAAAAQRNPASFMASLSECARLGLVPGDTYHLVPFGNEITGIIDYTGEIELIYRAGAVSSVKAEIVYRNDDFRYTTDMDRPEHAPDWFGDRGELIGAYAYAVMKDGATSKVVVYSKAEIDKVRDSGNGAKNPAWKTWYDRMALKTVIHRLEHFVPTSAEYRREQLRAAAEISQQVNSTAPVPAAPAAAAGIVDAELIDDTPDASPAGGQPTPDAARSVPTPEPAGEAPRPAAKITSGQVKLLDGHRQRLCDDSAEDWDQWLADLAKLAGLETPIAAPAELTQAEAKRAIDQLKGLGDAKALRRLLDTGEVRHGE
jgi:recombination protein RecT